MADANIPPVLRRPLSRLNLWGRAKNVPLNGFTLDDAIGEAIGAASTCWHPDKTFDSVAAQAIVLDLRAAFAEFVRLGINQQSLDAKLNIADIELASRIFDAPALRARPDAMDPSVEPEIDRPGAITDAVLKDHATSGGSKPDARRRILTDGRQTLHGVGLRDDRNGPFVIVVKVDNIAKPVVFNTSVWKVRWEDGDEPLDEVEPGAITSELSRPELPVKHRIDEAYLEGFKDGFEKGRFRR